jgi:hypothetical protein
LIVGCMFVCMCNYIYICTYIFYLENVICIYTCSMHTTCIGAPYFGVVITGDPRSHSVMAMVQPPAMQRVGSRGSLTLLTSDQLAQA